MVIERIDKYTILVDGHRIRATPDQEERIRRLTQEQRANFLVSMGYIKQQEQGKP